MRVMICSSPIPCFSISACRRRVSAGMARSASVIANPHSGRAGQAMECRVMGSYVSTGLTPCSARIWSIPALSLGSTSLMTIDCAGDMVMGRLYLSTMARTALLSFRPESKSRIRPFSMCSP